MAFIRSLTAQEYLKSIEDLLPLHHYLKTYVEIRGYNLADVIEILIQPGETNNQANYALTFKDQTVMKWIEG